MTIESGIENAGVYIDSLDDTYPAGGDDLVEGDNHIRGVKNCLLNTFANITGAVTATHTELNQLASRTLTSTDDKIDNFPAGTSMVFYNTSAPAGWVAEVLNDRALRVVSSNGGTGGGTSSFSTMFANRTSGSTTLSTNQIPAHSHTIPAHNHIAGPAMDATNSGQTDFYGSVSVSATTHRVTATNTGGGGTHGQYTSTVSGTSTGNNSTTGSGHTHSLDLRVLYSDVLICTKS